MPPPLTKAARVSTGGSRASKGNPAERGAGVPVVQDALGKCFHEMRTFSSADKATLLKMADK
eukprot:3341025-Lingulodinium_polyedra.AAC.1